MDNHSYDVFFSVIETFHIPSLPISIILVIHILARLAISILSIPSIIWASLIPSLLIISPSLALPFSVVVIRIIIWLPKTLFLLNLFIWCFKLYYIDRNILFDILSSKLLQWTIISFMPLFFIDVTNCMQKFTFFC